MENLRVSVFGGSTPKPDEEAYQQALHLGQLLGKAGYTVLTGGYIGTMEAVSRGAAESGGHVIGVTCDEIETWRAVAPNRWVQEEMRFQTVRQRLFVLIDSCNAALALPGGIGTLAEIALMWSNLQTGAITRRPLILVGSAWQSTMDHFMDAMLGYIPTGDLDLLTFTPNVEDALMQLQKLTTR